MAVVGTGYTGREFWLVNGTTSDDSSLKTLEPALCAYAPNTLAELIQRIAADAENRQGMALRELAIKIKEHRLILDRAAYQSLQCAWARLIASSASWSNEEEVAEFCLFDTLLEFLSSSEQLQALLIRPDKALDWTKMETKFKAPVSAADWRIIIDLIAQAATDWHLFNIVWFLSVHPRNIPLEVMQHLYSKFNQAPGYVRSKILHILHDRPDDVISEKFLAREWFWQSSSHSGEAHWASLLIIQRSSRPFSNLLSRIHPQLLGYALHLRGKKPDDMDQYVDYLHNHWQEIVSQMCAIPDNLPDCVMYCHTDADTDNTVGGYTLAPHVTNRGFSIVSPDSIWGGTLGAHREEKPLSLEQSLKAVSDEERKELLSPMQNVIDQQNKMGNFWINNYLSPHALPDIFQLRPDLVDQWLAVALNGEAQGEQALYWMRGFYEQLCISLLQEQDLNRGLNLYRRLDDTKAPFSFINEKTHIPLLGLALFNTPQSDELSSAWQEELDNCKRDLDLLDLVIAAETGTASSWLYTKSNPIWIQAWSFSKPELSCY